MRPIHLLSLIPICGVLVTPLVMNEVRPFILGMPFLLGWFSLMLVATSAVMACIYFADKVAGVHDRATVEGGRE